MQLLIKEIERAKRELSIAYSTTIEINGLVLNELNLNKPLTRAKFEEINDPLFKKK